MTDTPTTSVERLLPCPFCGGEARREDIPAEDNGDLNAGGSCISCTKCFACTAVHFGTKENLVNDWNRRPHPVPSQGVNGGLVSAKFEKQRYGAIVATILETDVSIVEVQERNDGYYGLIVHHRRPDNGEWVDLTAHLNPEHFDALGSVARRMRGEPECCRGLAPVAECQCERKRAEVSRPSPRVVGVPADLLEAEYRTRLRSSPPVVDGELLAACRHALKLLEPFADPELSLGLGSNALTPIRAAIAKAEAGAVHSDDLAVDRFAAIMKAKLAAARKKGRGGWDNPDPDNDGCTTEYLADLLREHIRKGDPVDVANFCMFLCLRGAALDGKPFASQGATTTEIENRNRLGGCYGV